MYLTGIEELNEYKNTDMQSVYHSSSDGFSVWETKGTEIPVSLILVAKSCIVYLLHKSTDTNSSSNSAGHSNLYD